MYDHLCYETNIPCLKMQTPFLEALRPLHGQFKLSFEALNIPSD